MSRMQVVLLTVIVVVWIPGLLALARVWSEVEYASHGFLVPLVALWAASAYRDELSRVEARPYSLGMMGIGLASAVYVAGLLLGNPTLIGLAFVATVVALVLALRGVAWVSTLRFSLGYLLFMVPLPPTWVNPVIVQLQIWVSSAGVAILRASDIPIYREGNVLTLPGDVTLFVAEACSGITSLITLLPIGVIIAYFTEVSLIRRSVLIAAVLPIALTFNLLRVIITVLLAMQVDVEFATSGPLHDWAGVGTYVVGCLCLIGIGGAMRRLWPETGADAPAS